MTLRIVFLMGKDPSITQAGDVAMSAIGMAIAAEVGHEVRCICLSTRAAELGSRPDLTRVSKAPVSAVAIGWRSMRTRHSLVHSRYDDDAFVTAIDADPDDPDLYVAEHSYMAEPFLRSRRAGHVRLLVNTHAPEHLVWGQLHGVVGRLDKRRIQADEARVARAAHSVAAFDRDEVDELGRLGVKRAVWLDLTMRPAARAAVIDSPPRLLFLGTGEWPPNLQAAQIMRAWWPEISAGIEGAELWIVGEKQDRARRGAPDPSIKELGFVPDLDAVLSSCRGLAAPIRIGGGVRVKLLHAVSRGVPVVTTSVGIGSLDKIFGITAYDDRRSFVARCRRLLSSAEAAAAEGARCYDANAAHWASGRPFSTLASWIAT